MTSRSGKRQGYRGPSGGPSTCSIFFTAFLPSKFFSSQWEYLMGEQRVSKDSTGGSRRYGQSWRQPAVSSPSFLQQSGQESPRLSIQSAMAKSAELRALQAALLQGSPIMPKSPLGLRPSPLVKPSDYPVFTPSYEDEPSPVGQHIRSKSQPFSNNFNGFEIDKEDEEPLYGWMTTESSFMFKEDEIAGSCSNHTALEGARRKNNPERTTSEEQNVVSVCNKCKPAEINEVRGISSIKPQQENHKGMIAWLFPKFNRKQRSKVSFKEETTNARDRHGSAISEVGEMRSSLVELKQKLSHLEGYCNELKKALMEATQGEPYDQRTRRMTPLRNPAPVSDEVMVEGFLQIVTEARVSVKHLCRSLMTQLEESGVDLAEKKDLSHLNSRYSREMGYHLQALVNRNFYQDFENCVFQKNGSQRVLDPKQERLENFSSFLTLRSLSWREISSRRNSQPQFADMVKFCEQKMAGNVGLVESYGPLEENVREKFFVAAKCIWLLHLLAFSFSPPLAILRVEEKRRFDSDYMEDVFAEKGRPGGYVKVMVTPGFYVQDRVVRCKVLCGRGSLV